MIHLGTEDMFINIHL